MPCRGALPKGQLHTCKQLFLTLEFRLRSSQCQWVITRCQSSLRETQTKAFNLKRARELDCRGQMHADNAKCLSDKPALPDHTRWCHRTHKSTTLKTVQQILGLTVVATVTPFLNVLKYGSQLWKEGQLVRQTEF